MTTEQDRDALALKLADYMWTDIPQRITEYARQLRAAIEAVVTPI